VVDSTATVGDAALSVTGYTGLTATEGAAFTGPVASFADTAPEDVTQGDYTATIDWGDGAGGTPDTSLGTVSAGQDSGTLVVNGYHTYSEAGVFDVTVTVSDVGGSTASAETTGAMTVRYGTLSASGRYVAGDPDALYEGGPIATFVNAGDLGRWDPTSDYTATITWPDYSQSEGTITPTAVPGQYSVSAPDDTGSHVLNGVGVEITGNATSLPISYPAYASTYEGDGDEIIATAVPIVATQGQAFSGPVAAFTDPNLHVPDDFSATITWPDNSTSPGTVTYDSADQLYVVSGSYTFTQAGSGFTVGVSISETDSYEVASACSPATVNEAVAATGRNGLAATEGAEFSGVVASFPKDPGANATGAGAPAEYSAAAITWEDGHASAGNITYNTTTGDWDVSGSYTYAGPGTYPISVQIDYGGAETTATSTITVGDAALSATPVTVATEEGQEFSGTVATFTDKNPAALSAAFTATINWGDGTGPSGIIASLAGAGWAKVVPRATPGARRARRGIVRRRRGERVVVPSAA
jgi:hypothetical protein